MAKRLFPVTLAVLVAGVATAVIEADHPPALSTPAAGAIRGRVELRQATESGLRVSVAELGTSTTHEPPDRRSVVYLDPAPRAAFDTRDDVRPRMDQRNETFVPHVLAIVAGTMCFRSRKRKHSIWAGTRSAGPSRCASTGRGSSGCSATSTPT